MQYVEFRKLPDGFKNICPYSALSNYLKRFSVQRGKVSHNHLLIITVPPYTPTSTDTLKRLGVDYLTSAGIEKSSHLVNHIRSAHASVSTALGEPLDSIMQHCTWAQKSTFYKYYFRQFSSDETVKLQKMAEVKRDFFA